MTVAIVIELMIVAARRGGEGGEPLADPGHAVARHERRRRSLYDTTAIRAKLARLKATLIGRCPEANSIAAADPVRTART